MQVPTPFHDFLLQLLEAEQSTVGAYDAAMHLAGSSRIRDAWRDSRAIVVAHQRLIEAALQQLEVDPEGTTEGRRLAHAYGVSLIRTIIVADAASRDAAEMCAAQALADLNARCCLNWELLDDLISNQLDDVARALRPAVEPVLHEKRMLCDSGADSLRRMWELRLAIGDGLDISAAFIRGVESGDGEGPIESAASTP